MKMVRMPYSQAMAEIKKLREHIDHEHDRYERERLKEEWLSVVRGIIPEVGIPCTIVYFSDYRAATVVEVSEDKKKVGVRFNDTKCNDWYAGDYEVLQELHGRVQYFTHRRNGDWIMEGQPVRDGVALALHYQRHYIDPHF